MIDISFIVPVFNKSKTQFNRCITSILMLKEIKYEVIIVDDGSEFELGKYYQDYCQKHGCKYFYEDNSGVSTARNLGIKKAKGEYITFVDADDYIVPNLTKKDLNKNCDLLIFNVRKINTTYDKAEICKVNVCRSNQIFDGEKLLVQTLKNGLLNWVFAKVYNRKYLNKNSLYFKTNKVNGEDIDFIIRLMLCNPTTMYINQILYVYLYSDVTGLERERKNLSINLSNLYQLWELRNNVLNKIKVSNFEELKVNIDNDYIKSMFEMFAHLVAYDKKGADKYQKTFLSYIYRINVRSTRILFENKIKIYLIKYRKYILIRQYVLLKKIIKKTIRTIK